MRIGYSRGTRWGLTVEEVQATLQAAEVERVYLDPFKSTSLPERVEALRALREGDVLVVPTLAHLARTQEDALEVMAGLVLRGVSVELVWDGTVVGKEVLALSRALVAAKRQWRRDRTPKTEEMKRRGRAGGRPHKMPDPSDRKMARAWWMNHDMTTAEVLEFIEKELGWKVSDDWMLRHFGKRPPLFTIDPKAVRK